MKKVLLQLTKELATDARIKGSYDAFLQSSFYKMVSNRYDLSLINE